MSIAFQCSCGTKLKAHEANAGQTVRCPNCALLLTVPTQALGYEVVEGEEPPQTVELVPEENFEALEDDRDLPTVERIRRPRNRPAAEEGPVRKSVESEFFHGGKSFAGIALSEWIKWGIGLPFILISLCCCGGSFLTKNVFVISGTMFGIVIVAAILILIVRAIE
jgi:hypothetical protein